MLTNLSQSEWFAIYDAMSGWTNITDCPKIEPRMFASMLKAALCKADREVGLGNRWDIYIPALCHKITEENAGEICQRIREFWGVFAKFWEERR
jgi:hypothetical protein